MTDELPLDAPAEEATAEAAAGQPETVVANGIAKDGITAAEAVKQDVVESTPKVDPNPLSVTEEMIEIEADMAATELRQSYHTSEVNAAKSKMKMLQNRMRQCARRAKNGTTEPLFPDAKPAPSVYDEDAWRAAPIAALDLPPKTVKALAEARIETMGALADFTASGAPLTKIKGVGKAAVDRISDESERFHSRFAASRANHPPAAAPA